jgi:hypothetical protein
LLLTISLVSGDISRSIGLPVGVPSYHTLNEGPARAASSPTAIISLALGELGHPLPSDLLSSALVCHVSFLNKNERSRIKCTHTQKWGGAWPGSLGGSWWPSLASKPRFARISQADQSHIIGHLGRFRPDHLAFSPTTHFKC